MIRSDKCWVVGIGLAALCGSACTPGITTAFKDLSAGRDAGGTRAGAAGAAQAAGSGSGTAGSGGGRPHAPPRGDSSTADFWCPATQDDETANAAALLDAINVAIVQGEFCLPRPLTSDSSLVCNARTAVSSGGFAPMGWGYVPPLDGWMWADEASSASEAKARLLADVPDELCDAARSTSYRAAGTAQHGSVWVFLMR